MQTVRSFIAIELDNQLLARIESLQTRLRQDLPGGLVRWVKPSGIHLTLQFLGDVAEPQLEQLAQALHRACSQVAPFAVQVAGMGCFPNAKRPRVIWVGIEEPTGTLVALQKEVAQANISLGFEPERRPFSPHLTLGRIKRGQPAALQMLGNYVSRSKVRIGEQQVAAVSLIRSDLYPSGAVYTQLSTVALRAIDRE